VLLALPMHLSPESTEGVRWFRTMKAIFSDAVLKVPSVGIVDSAVAAIVDAGCKDGICVSVGFSRVVVALVRNYQRVFSIDAQLMPLMDNLSAEPFMRATSLNEKLDREQICPESTWPAMYFLNSSLGDKDLPGFVCRALASASRSGGSGSSSTSGSCGSAGSFSDLLSAVVLTGGITAVLGFQDRFKREFLALLSSEEKEIFRLIAPKQDPARAVLRGVSIMAHAADVRKLFHTAETRDSHGATPLLSACYRGDTEAVELLLQAGANPENTEKNYNQTALMVAASRGHVEVCRILLARGANKLAVDRDGWTPYEIAQSKGHMAVLKLLEN